MDPDEIKYVPTKDLKFEEGAEELLHSPLMRPYIEAAKALLQNKNSHRHRKHCGTATRKALCVEGRFCVEVGIRGFRQRQRGN